MKKLRWGAAVVGLLVLGAATSVGVAVGCVWWPPRNATSMWQDEVELDGTRYVISLTGSFGVSRLGWTPVSAKVILPIHVRETVVAKGTNAAPEWSTIHDGTLRAAHVVPADQLVGPGRLDLRAGWPWRVLGGSCGSGEETTPISWEMVRSRGVVQMATRTYLSPNGKPNFAVRRLLPVGIEWTGMAESAALYGAAWWVVLCGPWMARRVLRRRLGRCVRCGYDRAGIAAGVECPECGCVPRVWASSAPIAAGGVG